MLHQVDDSYSTSTSTKRDEHGKRHSSGEHAGAAASTSSGERAGTKMLKLVARMAKHVDDLKITGDKQTVSWILEQIEKVFGKLKIEWHSFTNCGVRHIQDPTTKEVTLDQTDYIAGIKHCIHPDIQSQGPETDACASLHEVYWSVLGAIAFALLTRPDLSVFVAALQRWSHAPKIIHCKRLNTTVRWAQRNPRKLPYRHIHSLQRRAVLLTHTLTTI